MLSAKQKYIISHIEQLAAKYKYRQLPKKIQQGTIDLYTANLPEWCNIDGDNIVLVSAAGTVLCDGYERIVVGHYGAYIEVDRAQAKKENMCVKKGQEYRFRDAKFKDQVKYFWYTLKDSCDVKIYFQQKGVKYADYTPLKIYVSPYEVFPATDS